LRRLGGLRWIAALAVGLGHAGVAAEQPAAGFTVMIVELPQGTRFIGVPARCAGVDPDEDPAEIICFAELYQGPARVVRHIAGPRVTGRRLLRLIAHHMPRKPETQLLVATRPFEDKGTRGDFAAWWSRPAENGDYCEARESVAEWPDSTLKEAFLKARKRRFRPPGEPQTTEFLCIRG